MIPIFRGKKIDSDEYIEGILTLNGNIQRYGTVYATDTIEVDKDTIAIHFPNMLDKNSAKIFASLSEDGKGGTICKDGYNDKYICIFNKITNSCVMRYETIQLQVETMGVYDNYWKTYEITVIKD